MTWLKVVLINESLLKREAPIFSADSICSRHENSGPADLLEGQEEEQEERL
jgi:hypothetical protein